MSALGRISRQFAQDRHRENPQERAAQEILAGTGKNPAGSRRDEAKGIACVANWAAGRTRKEAREAAAAAKDKRSSWNGPESECRGTAVPRRTAHVA